MPVQVASAWRRLSSTIGAFSVAQRTIALIGVAVLGDRVQGGRWPLAAAAFALTLGGCVALAGRAEPEGTAEPTGTAEPAEPAGPAQPAGTEGPRAQWTFASPSRRKPSRS